MSNHQRELTLSRPTAAPTATSFAQFLHSSFCVTGQRRFGLDVPAGRRARVTLEPARSTRGQTAGTDDFLVRTRGGPTTVSSHSKTEEMRVRVRVPAWDFPHCCGTANHVDPPLSESCGTPCHKLARFSYPVLQLENRSGLLSHALWRAHCEAGIGAIQPILPDAVPYCQNLRFSFLVTLEHVGLSAPRKEERTALKGGVKLAGDARNSARKPIKQIRQIRQIKHNQSARRQSDCQRTRIHGCLVSPCCVCNALRRPLCFF